MSLPLFQYQEDGADWLIARQRFGLHDEMGVGKTATTIRAVDKIGAMRGLVVCPAHLRANWLAEFEKFSTISRRIVKVGSQHDMIAWVKGRFNIAILGYEQAAKYAEMVYQSGEPIDFIALDEAHYLKNASAYRTRQILGHMAGGGMGTLAEWAKYVWHITGTPMSNDPLDIYTFLRMCGATNLPQETFIRQFFFATKGAYTQRMQPKPDEIEKLKALIGNNSIRRTKKDVGMQLPPIFLTSHIVDGDTDKITELLKQYPDLEKAIIVAVDKGGLSFLNAQHTETLRRLIGEAKAVPYAHMLMDELSVDTDKRVVYGIHIDALTSVRDILVKHGIGAVLVNGQTSEKQREEAVWSFQNDPATRVFIGNMRAAGTGLTLTAACEVDLLESDWAPAPNAQALMRVHRIGQTRKVRGRFITLAKSIDEVVNRIVAAKTASIAQVEGFAMDAAPIDYLATFM
jgi:SWI/SNF-related matrix-associated actin-dependent regulator 1 of chromatin subfamily A